MNEKNVVLCGSNAYEKEILPESGFQGLPLMVKNELKIMCVTFTEDVGGILTMEFDEKGSLIFKTISAEGDALYDEIGSELEIKQIQEEKSMLKELEAIL